MDAPVKFIAGCAVSGALLIGALIFNPFEIVDPGHRGVVIILGETQPKALPEGFNFAGFFAKVVEVDIRLHKVEAKGELGTSDLMAVNGALVVTYRLNPESVPHLYQTVGLDYDAKLIAPAAQDRMKAVAPTYTAAEMVSKREEFRQKVESAIVDMVRERSHGAVIVENVVIANLGFPAPFLAAVQDKQVAEQQALREKNVLERIKWEAQQKIESAKAEAASLKAQREEITDKLLELRRIERDREAIQKWDGKLPTQMLGGAVPFFDVTKQAK